MGILHPKTALIYAYKTKDADKWGGDPDRVSLAYQVDQALAAHQCDFGAELTAHTLREFKKYGGKVKVANTAAELVLPLSEHKIQVPVPDRLLKDWELSDLLD